MPMPVSGNASDAFGVATMTWQASASSTPPPSARPCTRATTGFGQVSIARSSAWPRLVNSAIASMVPASMLPHEEPDVGAGDEGLAAAGDDDALHARIGGRGVERLLRAARRRPR